MFIFYFLVQFNKPAVTNFRGPGEVSFPLGIDLLRLQGLDPALYRLDLFDCLFFAVPVKLHPVHGFPELGQFLVNLVAPFHGGRIRFIFQGLPFNLKLDDFPVYGVDLRRHAVQLDAQV